MGYLTREAVLAAPDIRTVDVEVPEWGGAVRVRSLTGAERDRFELATIALRARGGDVSRANIRARLVSMACVDEAGQPLFSDADTGKLGEKSAKALERVFDVAARLSGLQPGDVEALAKN